MKFQGDASDLEVVVTGLGREIKSSADNGTAHQIKTVDGITLNLFRNGTLQIQGNPALKKQFEADYTQYNGTNSNYQAVAQVHVNAPQTEGAPFTVSNGKSKQVFIVHGHDDTAREQLELVLHKLGLDPFVLANTGGQGLTIIESLESKIGKDCKDTSFGIVLMTPDDMGYAQSGGSETIQPRARQNVVLEMGMLISSIGRRNLCTGQKIWRSELARV